ncbi:COMT, partial [Symbiodinium necroappetens]
MASDPGIPVTQHLSVSEVEDLYNAALADVQEAVTAEQRKERGQRLAALSKALRAAKRKPAEKT